LRPGAAAPAPDATVKTRLARGVYSTLLRLATPLYLLRLLWRSRQEPAYRQHLGERLALTVDRGLAWHVTRPLDADAMHRAAQALVGCHDFTTFRSAHCQSASPVKTLDRLDVRRKGEWVLVEAEARSFLHHQVRSMVGCLALVGTGQWEEGEVAEALAAADRTRLGLNAPPDGLYFRAATYPDEM